MNAFVPVAVIVIVFVLLLVTLDVGLAVKWPVGVGVPLDVPECVADEVPLDNLVVVPVFVGFDDTVGVLVDSSVALRDEVTDEVSLGVPDAVPVEISVGV